MTIQKKSLSNQLSALLLSWQSSQGGAKLPTGGKRKILISSEIGFP